jgi:Tfp pilus assembly protein PilN
MIRINLMGGPKVVAVAAPEGAPGISSMAVAAAVVAFVVFGGTLGAAYLYLSHQVTIVKTYIQNENLKYQSLQAERVEEQANDYLRKINQDQQEEEIINGLNQSKKGPVELMRAVGVEADRSNDLYLNSLSTASGRLSMKGTSRSIRSIASFLASLDKNGNFPDVKLEQVYEDDLFKSLAYKFELDCEFKPPGQPGGGAPPTGPGATPAGGRGPKPGI